MLKNLNVRLAVHFCFFFGVFLAGASFIACGERVGSEPPPTAPTITTQPASLTVVEGQTATFTVVASGTAPLAYQWRKDGSAISGATSPSYVIASAQIADEGSYTVVVSNSVEPSVTSSAATLTVTPVSTGSLQLTIKGLPAGVSAQTLLTGPGSYQQNFTASQLQANLAEGTYTLTAGDVGSNRATPTTQTITIVKDKVAFAYVIYASALANVRDATYGAVGDGVADDTEAIQKAVDEMAKVGGIVFVPNGVYMIRADNVPSELVHSSHAGIYLRSNLTFSMDSGASLKAFPTISSAYAILYAEEKININILGGTLVGERQDHLGSGGEYGYGLDLRAGSENVLVFGVTSMNCWGDGFVVDFPDPSKNITFDHVVADSNRRQGLSIINADGVTIRNSVFKNTGGTAPQSGIDIEPEDPSHEVKNVLISNCQFINNTGAGFLIPINQGAIDPAVFNVTVDGNTFINNGTPDGYSGIDVNRGNNHKLTNNIIENSKVSGINLGFKVSASQVSGNTISGSALHGMLLGKCETISVTQNHISGNTRDGIYNYMTRDVIINHNTLSSNGYYGIQSHQCTGGEITNNTFDNNTLGDQYSD